MQSYSKGQYAGDGKSLGRDIGTEPPDPNQHKEYSIPYGIILSSKIQKKGGGVEGGVSFIQAFVIWSHHCMHWGIINQEGAGHHLLMGSGE